MERREGRCQIILSISPTGEPLAEPWPCPGAGTRVIGADYWGRAIRACERHDQALSFPRAGLDVACNG
jgi:hypothetical protein